MKSLERELYQAQEFANRAGVTVRTLHVYDRIGLLAPAERTASGYRLYGQAQLERLEQIVALRFVGFTLQEIKELLALEPLPLISALRMQREIVRQRRLQLDKAMDAIDRASQAAHDGEPHALWETLRTLIEAMKMENGNDNFEWTKNYYSPQALETLEEKRATVSQEFIEDGQRAWAELIAEVESAATSEDPAGARAQELAARWKSLVGQFTGGDRDIHAGLNKLWNDQTHWPKDFKRPWSDQADAFIKKAMNCQA